MLPWNSSPRFSAKIQTSPDGRSSGSLRSVACAALWPWNTATRRHDVLPPRSLHCRIVPLSFTPRRRLGGGVGGVRGGDPRSEARDGRACEEQQGKSAHRRKG